MSPHEGEHEPGSAGGSGRALPALIVNADDFGFTPAVSAGIRRAHIAGIVTSTTALAVAPGVAGHLRLARDECPRLGIGVHLAVSGPWRPVLGRAVPTLRDRRGRLVGRRELRRVLERAAPAEVRDEWRAQLELVRSAFPHPDHLDSHHHAAYRHERLTELLLELASTERLPVRLPVPVGPTHADLEPVGPILDGSRLVALAAGHGVPHPTRLIDGLPSAPLEVELPARLAGLGGEDIVELCCHPGLTDWRLRRTSSLVGQRVGELAALTEPQLSERLKRGGVRLTDFRSCRWPS